MIRLTEALERNILAYIRAGGFPHVAAEAAGVPSEVFHEWMNRPTRRFRRFRRAVRQAQAQARLRVEIAVMEAKPLDWLKSGPGKPQVNPPGWTAAARSPAEVGTSSLLLDPRMQRLLSLLLDVIGEQPPLREQLQQLLVDFGE